MHWQTQPAEHQASVTVYMCRRPVVRSRANKATADKAYLPWRYHSNIHFLLSLKKPC